MSTQARVNGHQRTARLPAVAIRDAIPLTTLAKSVRDTVLCCNVCGVDVDPKDLPMKVWREADDKDRPISGDRALVFVGTGRDHAACEKRLNDHPRLYVEEQSRPGHFPELCGPCVHRDGLACRHPDLKANGGAGLAIDLDAMVAVVCITRSHGRSGRPIYHALTCAGRRTIEPVEYDDTEEETK